MIPAKPLFLLASLFATATASIGLVRHHYVRAAAPPTADRAQQANLDAHG